MPTISISSAAAEESGDLVFTVSLSEPSETAVTVQWRVLNGTGVSDSYGLGSVYTLTIPAGQTTATITVDTYHDTVDERDESIFVELFNPSQADFGAGVNVIRAMGVIRDNDGPGSNLALLVNAPIIVEGDSGIRQAVFEIRLSRPATADTSITYATADGTAQAGSDYTATSGTLIIRTGQEIGYVSVPVRGDLTDEAAESFFLRLGSSAGNAVGEATILDDDTASGLPEISVQSARALESGDLIFTVHLSEPVETAVTVQFRMLPSNGYYDAYSVGERYTLTFQPGQTSATIVYDTYHDTVDERDEFMVLELYNPSLAVLSGGVNILRTTGTILDDDGPGANTALFVSSPIVVEGDSGTRQAVFEIRLSQAVTADTTFTYATVNGTAEAGTDYVATTGSVIMAAGQSVAYVSVPVRGDARLEAAESFFLRVTSPAGSGAGEAVIQDDDAPGGQPSISVTPATALESGDLIFTINLSEAAETAVTVQYRLLPATAYYDTYEMGETFTITFQPGQTSYTVVYDTYHDTVDEVDEFVVLEVFNPVLASLSGGVNIIRTTGVILDDDGPGVNQAVFVGSPTIVEGDAGVRQAVFEVRVSQPVTSDTTFSYSTFNGTAESGSDYTATTGSLIIRAGQSVGYVSVPVAGDTAIEAAENFFLQVSSPLGSAVGEATIQDDDAGGALPSISVTSARALESGDLIFTATLSEAVATQVTVQFRLIAGTATSDVYSMNSIYTLTFQPGELSKSIVYDTYHDTADELDESVTLELFNPNQAVLAGGVNTLRATGVILDDDGPGANQVLLSSLTEARERVGPDANFLEFVIELSRPALAGQVLAYQTLDGTALAGSDYEATSGTINLAAGQSRAVVRVRILNDGAAEGNETLSLRVTPGAGIGGGAVTFQATINDNDIVGTAADNVINGSVLADDIFGLAGNDTLNGGDGADFLYGDVGNDVLDGGTGADRMEGGAGNDIYYVDNAGDVVIEAVGGGIDRVNTSVTWSAAGQDIENIAIIGADRVNIVGNELDNVMVGNDNVNALNGGRGADRMAGGGGNDLYYVDNVGDVVVEGANAGTDTVRSAVTYTLGANVERLQIVGSQQVNAIGNALDNVITGNLRPNVIIGMGGRDLMTGGAGADRFDFRSVSDSPFAAYDRITDLEDEDVINLSAIDANTNVAGDQAFFLAAAFTRQAGQLTLTYVESGNFTVLAADVDGDGRGDFRVILDGNHVDYDNFRL